MKTSNKVKEEDDGITHINVYSKGKTELGRLLSNFANTPVIIGDNHFASVESWWYWTKMNNFNSLFKIPRFSKYQVDSIKSKIGVEAKMYYRNIIGGDDRQFNPTKEQLKEVYLLKLEQNPKVKEMLLENKLPFAHYYIMKDKRVDADISLWTVDLWREIVEMIEK